MTRDLRRYGKQTNRRLVLGAVFVLIIGGGGLIYIIYGQQAAVLGISCILAGLIPVLLIIASLYLIDWIRKRAGND